MLEEGHGAWRGDRTVIRRVKHHRHLWQGAGAVVGLGGRVGGITHPHLQRQYQ
jgi:hypothetical protein